MPDRDQNDALQEQNPAEEAASRETSVGQAGQAGYAPSTVEINRSRMQGGGMGQSDLNRQQDPDRDDNSEKY